MSKILNHIKLEIQKDASYAWVNNKFVGTLEIATGVGKTFAAFLCAIEFMKIHKVGNDKLTLLFLAETTLREATIMEDLKKFESLVSKAITQNYVITFMCYQSAYKLKNTVYDLVVADEIHDSLTYEYSKYYKNNTYTGLIGLSATIERATVVGEEENNVTKGDLLDQICPVVYRLPQSEAIRLGLISDYNLIVIYNDLDSKNETIKAGTKAKPFYTSEKDAYDYLQNQFLKAYYMKVNTPADKDKKVALIKFWARKRSALLWQLPSKDKKVSKLVNMLDEKHIIFGNSLDALLNITKNVVCSRYSKLENEEIIENFATNKIKTIASFKQLKQGANLPNVRIGILHSYFSITKDYIQRVGRILRLRDDKQKAYLIVIVTRETQEMKWFNNMMVGNNIDTYVCSTPNDLKNLL